MSKDMPILVVLFSFIGLTSTAWVEKVVDSQATDWSCVALSSDGSYMIAIAGGGSKAGVWTSSDAGETFRHSQTSGNASGCAVSSYGDIMAAAFTEGYIQVSSDGGANWDRHDSSPNPISWIDLAMSSDGSMIAAVGEVHTWISADQGISWTKDSSSTSNWTSVAMSSNGTKIVKAGAGQIWLSSDGGSSFVADATVGQAKSWSDVAMSADGLTILAAIEGGRLWISSDGSSFLEDSSVPVLQQPDVAMSEDGRSLIAVDAADGVWQSSDGGFTWATTSVRYQCVAISGDGMRMVAGSSGNLWVKVAGTQVTTTVTEPTTTFGSATFTPGSADLAVEATEAFTSLKALQDTAVLNFFEEMNLQNVGTNTQQTTSQFDQGPEGQPIQSYGFVGEFDQQILDVVMEGRIDLKVPVAVVRQLQTEISKPVVINVATMHNLTVANRLFEEATAGFNQELLSEPLIVATYDGDRQNANASQPFEIRFPAESSTTYVNEECACWDSRQNRWKTLSTAAVRLLNGQLVQCTIQPPCLLALIASGTNAPEAAADSLESVLANFGIALLAAACILLLDLLICAVWDRRIRTLGFRRRFFRAMDGALLVRRFQYCSLAWTIIISLTWLIWSLFENGGWSSQPPFHVFWLSLLFNMLMYHLLLTWILDRRKRQRNTRPLFDVMDLVLFFIDADVALVRVEYLLELYDYKGLWSRRQEAQLFKTQRGQPALVSHLEMFNWAEQMEDNPEVQARIVAVSHCWETQQHPDPYGFQAAKLAEALRPKFRQDPDSIPGVFIDYMSLFQFQRHGKHQNSCFQLAMKNMHQIYSHEWTHTFFIHDLTPDEIKKGKAEDHVKVFWKPPDTLSGQMRQVKTSELKENNTLYFHRGWCLAEMQWSVLRMSNHFNILAWQEQFLCKAPMPPITFRKMLSQTEVAFTHRSDFLPLVEAQRDAFELKAKGCEKLALTDLPAEQIDILGDALQEYEVLKELHLVRCSVCTSGFLKRVAFSPILTRISLQRCKISDDDIEVLIEALSLSQWTHLDLAENEISSAGAQRLAEALKRCRLEELSLRGNRIGAEGRTALQNLGIASLDLNDNDENKVTQPDTETMALRDAARAPMEDALSQLVAASEKGPLCAMCQRRLDDMA